MPPYHDVYVLARERSAAVASRFLEAFVPNREQWAVNYVFPQYSDQPVVVIESAAEAILHCEIHPDEAQSFYFRNLGIGPAHAMLYFTGDSGLILGLSVDDEEDEWFAKLKESVASEIGYIAFESPPATTVTDFTQLATGVR